MADWGRPMAEEEHRKPAEVVVEVLLSKVEEVAEVASFHLEVVGAVVVGVPHLVAEVVEVAEALHRLERAIRPAEDRKPN